MSHSNPPTEANPLPCTNQFAFDALFRGSSFKAASNISFRDNEFDTMFCPPQKKENVATQPASLAVETLPACAFKITQLSAICGDGSLSQSLMLFYVWLSQSSSSDISKPHIK